MLVRPVTHFTDYKNMRVKLHVYTAKHYLDKKHLITMLRQGLYYLFIQYIKNNMVLGCQRLCSQICRKKV